MRAQIVTTLVVNLLTIVYGISVGWAAPNMLLFQSADSPIGIMNSSQISFIVSILCIGGFVGTVLFGYMADICGRKIGLIIIAVPQIAANILLLIGSHYYYVYAARFLFGLTAGGVFIMIPIFVSEISHDKIRGALGTVLALTWNTGIVIGYVLASWMDYYSVPYVAIGITIVFLVVVVWLPESPDYLAHLQKDEEAAKSYRFYGNYRASSKLEIGKLVVDTSLHATPSEEQQAKPKITFEDFKKKSVLKGFFVSMILIFFVDGTGIIVIRNFMTELFAWAKIDLDVYVGTIVVGIIQIGGVIVSTFSVDRFGRRVLLFFSASGTSMCLVVFGFYYHILDKAGYEDLVKQLQWLPVTSLGLAVLIATFGVTTMPYVLMAELTPVKLRSVVTTAALAFSWIFSFFVQQYYHSMIDFLGVAGTIWVFAVVCFMEIIFVYVFLPETKNLTFDEIQLKLQ